MATVLCGCAGEQSAFSAFGVEAESTRTLTYAMFAVATVITVGVLWLAFHAAGAPEGRLSLKQGMRLILWLGALGPSLVLGVLLILSLPGMRTIPTDRGELRVEVEGEQFWWRVRYRPPGAEIVETANEIRVPVGRTVTFVLTSSDVIHSFWIPGLAGKVDMIPGRTNDLVVRATRPGVYRGVCAEFCGLAHARMAFDVVAMEPAAFEAWLVQASQPARLVASPGRAQFEGYGCGGCHAVRGHGSAGVIGPDLTHLGARRTIGASTLVNTPEAIEAFIYDPAAIKPGVLMPSFRGMPSGDRHAIAEYLAGLE